MKIALVFAMVKTVHLLKDIQKVDTLPLSILLRVDALLSEMATMSDEIVNELADSGHCAIFLDCGRHEFAWDCRVKRGGVCPYNHVRVTDTEVKGAENRP